MNILRSTTPMYNAFVVANVITSYGFKSERNQHSISYIWASLVPCETKVRYVRDRPGIVHVLSAVNRFLLTGGRSSGPAVYLLCLLLHTSSTSLMDTRTYSDTWPRKPRSLHANRKPNEFL